MPHTPETDTCHAGRKKSLLRWGWILLMLAAISRSRPDGRGKRQTSLR